MGSGSGLEIPMLPFCTGTPDDDAADAAADAMLLPISVRATTFFEVERAADWTLKTLQPSELQACTRILYEVDDVRFPIAKLVAVGDTSIDAPVSHDDKALGSHCTT